MAKWIQLGVVCFAVFAQGCRHDHLPSPSTGGHDYDQMNLVADTEGMAAARIDTGFSGPWGMAVNANGEFWVALNSENSCALLDGNGAAILADIGPWQGSLYSNVSWPAGAVYNNTADFYLGTQPAPFLFATELGMLAGWKYPDTTTTFIDRSYEQAVFKGVTLARDSSGTDCIYAADFYNARIDVFNSYFSQLFRSFSDPVVPAGFAPFNIRNINGLLYVTYAKQVLPRNGADQPGIGNGFVDVFTTEGALVKRFAAQGSLNSPIAVVQAPASFGLSSGAILVGNAGDGTISVFDSTGSYIGPLENDTRPITIPGLRDMAFSSDGRLYFTAAPYGGYHGLFGYIKLR